MIDHAADVFRNAIGWLLLALGVTFAQEAWIGGMLLAMAGASFAIQFQPEKTKIEFWSVIAGAFIVAHIAGMVSVRIWPEAPVQMVMCLAGVFSRYIARMAFKVAGRTEGKADQISDKLIDRFLPGDDGKGDA